MTTLLVVINSRTRREIPESPLLTHLGLSSKAYTLQGESVGRPAFWEPNASFGDVFAQWSQSVHQVGDSIPTWFAGRDGVFVVVRRLDESLVGTRWTLIGGKARIVRCADQQGRFCGITVKRVGGTWVMGAPETRGPLP